MSDTGTAISALQRNWSMVDQSLANMDDASMASRPNDQTNSIAWLLWHMNRVVDRFVNDRFQDKPQQWVSDGWHDKFGMPANPDDNGRGWTAEQVAAWQPPAKEVMVGYYDAVKSNALAYVGSLSAADLEKQVPFPAPPNTLALGEALGVLVFDNIVHGGQIAFIKGYYEGMGWFG